MKAKPFPRSQFCKSATLIILSLILSAAAAERGQDESLLPTAERELQRAHASLAKLDPAPYFMSYAIRDQQSAVVVALQGSLITSNRGRTRVADVVTRVGSPALDNTHGENRRSALRSGLIPIDNDPDAIARALWSLTYGGYREAAQAFLKVKTQSQVNVTEEDTSADFAPQAPAMHADTTELLPLADQHEMETLAQTYSAAFRSYPYIYSSQVVLIAQTTRNYFISTEGTRVVDNNTMVRMLIVAATQSDDGMELIRVENYQAQVLSHLPPEAQVRARIEKMAADLKALRTAPVAEPSDGPVLLSGRAAAVLFHEVLGHRLEGQRQRGENEAQTFTKRINQQVLPGFLSVVDDPTMQKLNGVELSGWYEYDSEGVSASRVIIIDNGILKNFLMSRMPVHGFDKSNGHGRSESGAMPVGRQGNLIVSSTKTANETQLRQRFIDQIKKQGKPYGLYFEDIQGGFTITQTGAPQAFVVLPVMVWKVYPDGRPDELVRGVDIVGTPLAAMNRILMTGDTTEVFNGVCGAESGRVPVSAASPSILFADMEVQKRAHSLNRPPILSPPGFAASAPASPKAGQR